MKLTWFDPTPRIYGGQTSETDNLAQSHALLPATTADVVSVDRRNQTNDFAAWICTIIASCLNIRACASDGVVLLLAIIVNLISDLP